MRSPHISYESEYALKKSLLTIIKSNKTLTEKDIHELRNFVTEEYSLLGLIGLLTGDTAKILLGRKQTTSKEILDLCNQVSLSPSEIQNELTRIADLYMETDHSEIEEIVFRKVMLEYPPIKLP